MPLSKSRSGREVQHGGAPTNTMVYVATSRGSKWFASLPSGLGTIGAARAATRATYTGGSLRVSSVSNCRCRNLLAPEEPDAFIVHVRVCGEGAGEPVPLPGSRLGIASACPSLRPFPAAETERWCAKRSLAFLIGGKSLRRKVSPTTLTECCACEGGANRTTRVKRTQGTT